MKLELEEGDELLQSVQTCVGSVLPTLNPSGRNRVQSNIETLFTSMAGLKSQLDKVLAVNERCHSLWCQYDIEHNAFSSWITSQSDELQTEPQKRSSLEDKKAALSTQQVQIPF